jgi:hypothetical protein
MKTLKSSIQSIVTLTVWLITSALCAQGQSPGNASATEVSSDTRPQHSDATSLRLINNYLVATGGREAHRLIRNLVAEGTIKESTLERRFRLIETFDGKRHLTYEWIHLGRQHRVIYVHDGLKTWTQVLAPKKEDARAYGGLNGAHFAHQSWLLQPFTLPAIADYTFKYQGQSKIRGRSTYLIKAYGPKDRASWFYFDEEKFLLIRWGGKGMIAGVEEYLDYQAIQFKPFNGLILPSKIDLLAENSAYGHIRIERVEMNGNLDNLTFFMPESIRPTLRQRPVIKN